MWHKRAVFLFKGATSCRTLALGGLILPITIHSHKGAVSGFSVGRIFGRAGARAPHPFTNRGGLPNPNIGVM